MTNLAVIGKKLSKLLINVPLKNLIFFSCRLLFRQNLPHRGSEDKVCRLPFSSSTSKPNVPSAKEGKVCLSTLTNVPNFILLRYFGR